jgi:integrase
MAKKKQAQKAKEPIRLRYKQLANGNQSIYLDYYRDGRRSYEFLKLYLIPETDENAVKQNQNTKQAATAIKAQRLISITNDKAGIKKHDALSKMLLTDWIDEYGRGKATEKSTANIAMMKRHIEKYTNNRKIMMRDVDDAFCRGFISYLANDAYAVCRCSEGGMKDGRQISKSTAAVYFGYFVGALNEAVRKGIIASNPAKLLSREDKKPVKAPKPQRGYLTIDEIKAIIATDCRSKQNKQAFLFAVFCGLRISDIRALKWGDLFFDGKQWRARLSMQKTKERLELPLSDEAVKWLPKRGNASNKDAVFDRLPATSSSINSAVKRLVKRAGIERDICFHVSRHTFATTLLTLGADLYTTSKLLGHKQISTTQIYADIVGKKKAEAVNLLGKEFE